MHLIQIEAEENAVELVERYLPINKNFIPVKDERALHVSARKMGSRLICKRVQK